MANKVKEFIFESAASLNPYKSDEGSAQKAIEVVSIAFGLISLFQIVSQLNFVRFTFTQGFGNRAFEGVMEVLILLYPAVATYLFWKRKAIGWVLLMSYIVFMMGTAIFLFYSTIVMQGSHSPLDALMPHNLLLKSVLWFLFYAWWLWIICTRNVRLVYGICMPEPKP